MNHIFYSAAIFCLGAVMTISSYASITQRDFGATPEGDSVKLFTLSNAGGIEVEIMTLGATVVSLKTPDRDGRMADIVLGFDNVADYWNKSPYFGCVVGRVGNRIANGQFSIGGEVYQLAQNNGPNALHGGLKGFDKAVWKARVVSRGDEPAVKFSHVSPDGDEGYPGRLECSVTYTLTADNKLVLDYEAESDAVTPVNLTNHSYFNLRGQGNGDILDHVLSLNAPWYTPVNETLIPTGEILSVKGTPFDFTSPHVIGDRIDADHPQIEFGGGYDHNFVFHHPRGVLSVAGQVYEPDTGREMTVFTTEPGVQFYAGNFLDGTLTGKDGKVYEYRYGFCLETQHFPDSPNQHHFPSAWLKPGETMTSQTVFAFSAR